MKVVGTIPFGDRVHGLAIDPKAHALYAVGDERPGDHGLAGVLKIIDTTTGTVRATTQTGAAVRGVTVDPRTHRVSVLAYTFKDNATKLDEASVREFDGDSGAATGSVKIESASNSVIFTDLKIDPVAGGIYALEMGKLYVLSR